VQHNEASAFTPAEVRWWGRFLIYEHQIQNYRKTKHYEGCSGMCMTEIVATQAEVSNACSFLNVIHRRISIHLLLIHLELWIVGILAHPEGYARAQRSCRRFHSRKRWARNHVCMTDGEQTGNGLRGAVWKGKSAAPASLV
jgi:hypothetical protein